MAAPSTDVQTIEPLQSTKKKILAPTSLAVSVDNQFVRAWSKFKAAKNGIKILLQEIKNLVLNSEKMKKNNSTGLHWQTRLVLPLKLI